MHLVLTLLEAVYFFYVYLVFYVHLVLTLFETLYCFYVHLVLTLFEAMYGFYVHLVLTSFETVYCFVINLCAFGLHFFLKQCTVAYLWYSHFVETSDLLVMFGYQGQ